MNDRIFFIAWMVFGGFVILLMACTTYGFLAGSVLAAIDVPWGWIASIFMVLGACLFGAATVLSAMAWEWYWKEETRVYPTRYDIDKLRASRKQS